MSAMPGLELGRIKAGEPFVEQENFRIAGQSARELDPFLIDVGQRCHGAWPAFGKPDPLQQSVRVVVEFLAPAPRVTKNSAGRDVLQHGQVGQHAHQLKRARNAFSAMLLAPMPAMSWP